MKVTSLLEVSSTSNIVYSKIMKGTSSLEVSSTSNIVYMSDYEIN
jgi:hypothetical protein